MSIARPAARRLVSRCLAASTSSVPAPTPAAASIPSRVPCERHSFHSSSAQLGRRKPRFANIQAAKMGLVDEDAISKYSKKHFPSFTEEEEATLAEHYYTPEQMEALKLGEKAIDPKDLTIQGRLRNDINRINYIDDFATIMPVIDSRPKDKPTADHRAKLLGPDEFVDDFFKWAEQFVPQGVNPNDMNPKEVEELLAKHAPTDVDFWKYMIDRPSLDRTGQSGNTSEVPQLMRNVPGMEGLQQKQDPDDEGLDDTGDYTDIKKKTGMTLREIQDYQTKLLVLRWVSNQTRLGKIQSSSCMTMAGDGNGRLGIGMVSGTDHETASEKAKQQAIKNMKPVVRHENRTIFGNIRCKISGTVVELYAKPPGYGLRVPELIFEMCRAAGIRDLAARIPRSKNKMNIVKATYHALTNQPDPEEIARGRGKKLVDVRKVYYGGAVY